MYESQFLLKRRPFTATPDSRCFLAAGPIQAVLDELVVCVEQGQGVAIVSAPAGTGKTLLCERLRTELTGHFEIVFLRHASFLTRRALLQSILADLNHAYRRHDEQELRLELIPAIRALNPQREALVLICDEAHMLNEDLLEELRILSDLAEQGCPLVRLVLVGQPGLEETLARPGLEALNQRIRAHVCLETFDRAAALDYIDYRITWAGGRTDEIFTPEALELICRASQGVPRCINQLCDHALLLAYVSEQKPVLAETIRDALQDLRQLPLHWNESFLTDVPTDSRTTEGFESIAASPPSAFATIQSAPSIGLESPSQFQSVEFGADLPLSEATVEQTSDPTMAGLANVSNQSPDLGGRGSRRAALPNGSPMSNPGSAGASPSQIAVNVNHWPPLPTTTDPQNSTTEFEATNDIAADEEFWESEPAKNTHVAKDQAFPKPSFIITAPPPVKRLPASSQLLETVEEIVWDRYAAIDGGFPIPARQHDQPRGASPGCGSDTLPLPPDQPCGASPGCSQGEGGCDTPTPQQVHGNEEIPENLKPSQAQDPTSHETPPNPFPSFPSVPSNSETVFGPNPDAVSAQDWTVPPEPSPANNPVGDGFDAVCARLEDLLPEVDEKPGWDSSSLEFGSEQPGDPNATIFLATRHSPLATSDETANEIDEGNSLEEELGMSVCELASEVRAELNTPNDGSTALEQLQELLGTGQPDSCSIEIGTASSADNLSTIPAKDAARPYRNLFSQLRRKQQGLL